MDSVKFSKRAFSDMTWRESHGKTMQAENIKERAAITRAFCRECASFLRVENMGNPPCQRDFYYIIEIFGKVCALFGPLGVQV